MTDSSPPAAQGRRDFLRMSTLAAASLSVAAGSAQLAGCASSDRPASGFVLFRPDDVTLLAALAPVILVPVLTPAQAMQSVKAMDTLVYDSSVANRDGFIQLLDALQLAPLRYYFTGLWKPFDQQPRAELEQGVAKWWQHGSELGQISARGIMQAMEMGWYLQPENWPSIGYPGPPKKVIV